MDDRAAYAPAGLEWDAQVAEHRAEADDYAADIPGSLVGGEQAPGCVQVVGAGLGLGAEAALVVGLRVNAGREGINGLAGRRQDAAHASAGDGLAILIHNDALHDADLWDLRGLAIRVAGALDDLEAEAVADLGRVHRLGVDADAEHGAAVLLFERQVSAEVDHPVHGGRAAGRITLGIRALDVELVDCAARVVHVGDLAAHVRATRVGVGIGVHVERDDRVVGVVRRIELDGPEPAALRDVGEADLRDVVARLAALLDVRQLVLGDQLKFLGGIRQSPQALLDVVGEPVGVGVLGHQWGGRQDDEGKQRRWGELCGSRRSSHRVSLRPPRELVKEYFLPNNFDKQQQNSCMRRR